MNGKYQVGSGRVVAFTHDTPFINNIISQTSKSVNNKSYSFGEEDLDFGIKGETIDANERILEVIELAVMLNTELSKSAQKNNTAESGGVKYSHKINTDYSDLSKLDAESLKVYNDRGWAQQLLRAEDWVLYNEHIGYKLPKDSKCFKSELKDGSLLLEINNKLLIVNGQYGSDEIYGVLAINAPSEGHASWIKEALYNDTEGLWLNKESYGEVCESLQDVFGERVFRYYNGADYSYRKGQYHSKQRATLPSYWENFGYTKDKQNGAGVFGNTQKRVSRTVSEIDKKSYSFGEEDLDFGLYFSEKREVAENLKESGRAIVVEIAAVMKLRHFYDSFYKKILFQKHTEKTKNLENRIVKQVSRFFFGGDKRDRTADLLNAIQALSQLSYTPEDIHILH